MCQIRKLLTFWHDSGPQGKQIPFKQLKTQKLWGLFTELSHTFMNFTVKSVLDTSGEKETHVNSDFHLCLLQPNSFWGTIYTTISTFLTFNEAALMLCITMNEIKHCATKSN